MVDSHLPIAETQALGPWKGTRGRPPHGPAFPPSPTFSLTCRHEEISPMLGRKPRKASQAPEDAL